MATAVDLQRHPIQFVSELRRQYGTELELSFASYFYLKRERTEIRQRMRVPIQEVTPSWLRKELSSLEKGWELALESRVRMGSRTLHIPMLDFRGMARGQLLSIRKELPEPYGLSPSVYFTGRSFHAYFLALVTSHEWVRFMGSALLCNVPGKEVVDQRWVGHRLLGGYGSLRWSKNTNRHAHYPVQIPASVLDLSETEKNKILSSSH